MSRFTLIGCPFDNGIRSMRRFGRGVVGAAEGPAAIFGHFPDAASEMLDLERFNLDSDDPIKERAATETAHEMIEEAVRRTVEFGVIPVVIGGDHSIAYPVFRGLGAKGVINIDAHFDMRPLEEEVISSGNAFRRIIEEGLDGQRMAAIGIRRSDSEIFAEMERFARGESVTIVPEPVGDPRRAGRRAAGVAGPQGIHLSIDMDVLNEQFAPGVSAPNPAGLSLDELLAMVETILWTGTLAGVDISETSSRGEGREKLDRTAASAARVLERILEA